jgi:hypothetical protein
LSPQTVTGVSLADLSTNNALVTFQTAIVAAVSSSLNLAATGGSVTIPVITAATRKRTLLAAITRVLLQSKGVNAAYNGTLPPFFYSQCVFHPPGLTPLFLSQ